LIIFFSGCFNPTYTKKKLVNPPPKLSEFSSELKDSTIYSIDAVTLKNYLAKSNRKYNLIVSYTYWCPTANYSFNDFASLSLDSNINLIFFTADDWFYLENYKTYLKNKNYYKPTFILDIQRYGTKFNPHPKYKKFFREITETDINIGGFPSYILLDSNLSLIYSKSGIIDSLTYKLMGH